LSFGLFAFFAFAFCPFLFCFWGPVASFFFTLLRLPYTFFSPMPLFVLFALRKKNRTPWEKKKKNSALKEKGGFPRQKK